MMLSSLAGLPPLPKSLSGLLNISNSQSNSRESSPAHTQHSSPYRTPRHSVSSHTPGAHSGYSSALLQGFPGHPGGAFQGVVSGGSYALVGRPVEYGATSSPLRSSEERNGSQLGVNQDLSSAKSQVSRKFSSLDSQLSFLRKEMVSLRQVDMNLLCQLWSLNESIQELKLAQSRNSSLSPHDWLDQEGDSDASEEYYSGADYASPEDSYAHAFNGNESYRNGHGLNDPRLNLRHVSERRYRNGSNSSVEYGDI